MKAKPQIYLSYAREDEKHALELYDKLSNAGFEPWIDKQDLLPGEPWESSIRDAVRHSDFFIALLSTNSASSDSFRREIGTALQTWGGKPEGTTSLIPVRLEPCEVPDNLRRLTWVDLFEEDGWNRLQKAITRGFAPRLPRPEPPEDLVKACLEGNCILYVGSGLSASAGLPTWNPFVNDLLSWAVEQKFIDPSFGESLKKAIESGESNIAADSILGALEDKDRVRKLNNYLQQLFLEPSQNLTEAHHIIREIGFSAILTTNFDRLLERTFEQAANRVYTPQDTEPLLEALSKRAFFILKLYGILDRPETVLVAPAQYEDAIVGNLAFSEFMDSLFVSRTLLFVGSSLNGIQAYLEGIKLRGSSRQHYALVSVGGEAWEAKAELLWRRHRIRVLPYTSTDDHSEVLEFLTQLAEKTKRHDKKAEEEGLPPQASLRRIRLENIGPFDNLDLELDRNWNILLGDNGVGKSTILKAIAVAICGKDGQPYAGRLIKSGHTSGKIVLETSRGNEYLTKISLTSGEAQVRSVPARPLETEGWLALGFPPLRAGTWEQPKGPEIETGKLRPTSQDVLPLVKGEPDPRVDSLKQWIVNLDYWMKDERDRKSGENRYDQLLREFFRIVDHLTEGVKIQFKGIDPQTNRITVVTDDGEVPLEALSQGTASLIGWIGILLQRLYEIYGERDRPRERYALVLMDEIDAHMHPEWQQSLIPNLMELFPNVQFVTTTHSPLIVGSREPREVFLLRRDEENPGRVLVERPEEPLQGWRADQILTSSLFGLQSSRDAETQKTLMRYTELSAKTDRTPDEEQELKVAAQTLKMRLPSSAERKEAREASEMIQRALKEQWKAMPPEKRKSILDEVQVQLQEVITGSRRPT